MDWLRFIRFLTLYVAPGLAALVAVAEIVGRLSGPPGSSSVAYAYHHLLLVVFSLLTAILIGICGWMVSLWDLDRLVFKLEGKVDSQIATFGSKSAEGENKSTIIDRAGERLLNSVIKGSRAKAVSAIERSYWSDINAGGSLAFPKPDITAAIDQIERSRHDLLAPLTQIISPMVPLGSVSAPILSRLIFMHLAPEIKVRLYRRLLWRFLSQLGALFVLTAICFYISILAWSRVSESVFFSDAAVTSAGIALYQLDLMLRGALFDFMQHTGQSISPIAANRNATAFLYYTLIFRMFVAMYVMSSLFKVFRFVLRHWRALLR